MNKNDENEDIIEESNNDSKGDSFMYFIKSGIYNVYFEPLKEDENGEDEESKQNQSDKKLRVGDHFGEIGWIYECKRTATVRSENYGQLAMLKKSKLQELQRDFPEILDNFKFDIMMYKDPQRIFLEATLSQVSYFDKLKEQTK